jgi:hypothetical protein
MPKVPWNEFQGRDGLQRISHREVYDLQRDVYEAQVAEEERGDEMKFIKAVAPHCPECDEIVATGVALGEDLSIYLVGECCEKQVVVNLEQVIMQLGGSECGKAN